MPRSWNQSLPCSAGCGGPRDRIGQHYCRECHNAYQRANRRRYSQLSPIERKKANARTMANEYRQRGKLVEEPCRKCSTTVDLEMHHEDYSKPLDIVWLCRTCHKQLHLEQELSS